MIRARTLLKYRPGEDKDQEDALIENGDKVAHSGSALLDASLFSCPEDEHDDVWRLMKNREDPCEEVYGMSSEEIFQHRDDADFLAVLDCLGTAELKTKYRGQEKDELKQLAQRYCQARRSSRTDSTVLEKDLAQLYSDIQQKHHTLWEADTARYKAARAESYAQAHRRAVAQERLSMSSRTSLDAPGGRQDFFGHSRGNSTGSTDPDKAKRMSGPWRRGHHIAGQQMRANSADPRSLASIATHRPVTPPQAARKDDTTMRSRSSSSGSESKLSDGAQRSGTASPSIKSVVKDGARLMLRLSPKRSKKKGDESV